VSGPRIFTWPQDEVPYELRGQVRALHDQAWPPEPDGPERCSAAGHDPALRPLEVLLVDDGRVLAALDILSKELEHAGERYSASGLSTVVTDEALRGRGHGLHLVRAARELIAASGADLGIFTCDRPLGPFYESAGWTILPGAVLIGGTPRDPFPSDQWDKVVLASFFSERARCRAGDFAGARIGLFPGIIDRLW
jgi:aminoglycoside 2'-N-acetyltransferase I